MRAPIGPRIAPTKNQAAGLRPWNRARIATAAPHSAQIGHQRTVSSISAVQRAVAFFSCVDRLRGLRVQLGRNFLWWGLDKEHWTRSAARHVFGDAAE